MNTRPFLGWFVSPAGLVAAGLVAAMLAVFQYSVRTYIPGSLEVGGFTWQNFAAMLRPLYALAFWNTVLLCFETAVFTLILAYPLAYALVRTNSSALRSFILIVSVAPLFLGEVVRTYSWIVVLGNGGLVNRALQWLGLTDAPVSFLYNELGVTIGMANVLLPFLVLPLFAAMIRIDDRLMQAAASLGAPPRTIFWKVYFPLTLPALAAGTLLVFILCLGFYVTPAVLGGGRVPMISNLLDTLINQIPRWEQASAISTILLIVTLLIFAAYRRLDRKASA